MGFWIAYADPVTGLRDEATEVLLSPGPNRVEYPQDPAGSRHETAETVIVQQPNADNRIRAWLWEKWPGWYPNYQAVWDAIEPLRGKYRKMAGDATPYVYVKEDETQLLRTIAVTGHTVTPTSGWLRARVVEVSRRMRTDSSLVTYEETRLAFVIADPSYNDF